VWVADIDVTAAGAAYRLQVPELQLWVVSCSRAEVLVLCIMICSLILFQSFGYCGHVLV